MILSSRLHKIIDICLNRDDYVTVPFLAEAVNTSTRTVFREIKEIEYLLKPFNLSIETKSKKGIKIVGSDENREKLKAEISNSDITYLNKQDRQNLLIFEILRTNNIEKIYYYANMFQVSEATISNDLDDIEPWFLQNKLAIIRKPGFGIELNGSEKDYRNALALIVEKSIQDGKLDNFAYDPQSIWMQMFANNPHGIMKLLNQEVLLTILKVMETHTRELALNRYAQSSYIGLIIHLSVAIDRILKGERIEPNSLAVKMMQNDESYEQASKMGKYLEKAFNITLPEQEIAFIAMHIQGAKLNHQGRSDDLLYDTKYERELKLVVNEMIAEFNCEEDLTYDNELCRGLLAHFKPTLVRLKYSMPIFNPMLDDLKKMYSTLFEETRRVCHVIVDHFNLVPSENEIGFITMHFGAAIERAKNKKISNRVVKIGVICSSGIGVSALLSAKIKQVVDDFVEVKAYSLQDVITKKAQADLLLSTFDISKITKNYIRINALLTNENVEVIHHEINRIRNNDALIHHREKQNFMMVNKVSGEMLNVLDELDVKILDTCESFDSLCNEACEMINDVEEVQKAVYNGIKEREAIESTVYPQAGFALLHCKCNEVNQSILKVIVLKQSSAPELQGIRFALLMVIREDAESYITNMMGSISAGLVDDSSFVETLSRGELISIRDAVEGILRRYLQSIV